MRKRCPLWIQREQASAAALLSESNCCLKSPSLWHIVMAVMRHHLLPFRCSLDILLSPEGFIVKDQSLPAQRDHLQLLYLWPFLGCALNAGWFPLAEHKPQCVLVGWGSNTHLLSKVAQAEPSGLCVSQDPAAVRGCPWCFPWKSSGCFYSNRGTQSVSPGKRHGTQWTFHAVWFLLDMGSC